MRLSDEIVVLVCRFSRMIRISPPSHLLSLSGHSPTQECYFHKARIDQKSPAVTSRLAKQSAIMYSEVERLLGVPALQQYMDKSWLVRGRGWRKGDCS